MAMACRAGAARACRRATAARGQQRCRARHATACAATPVKCVSVRGGENGRERGSDAIRFRFCANLPQPAGAGGPRIFGAFVALLQARYRLSGSLEVSRSRRISRGESRSMRRPFGPGARPRAVRTKDNWNGSSDCTGAAAGSGADRHYGRCRHVGRGGAVRGASRARPDAAQAAGQAGGAQAGSAQAGARGRSQPRSSRRSRPPPISRS